MGRKKNDGLGRLGGRVKGIPNKDKPLKVFLREHSLSYFTPSILAYGLKEYEKLQPLLVPDRLYSQYELDLLQSKPSDRISAELSLLKFHTPQMQASSVDMTVTDENQTLSQRLAELSQEPDSQSNQ